MTQQEYEVCRDIGFRTAIHDWNFCKRAQAIQIFFGNDGVYAFKYGYDIGMYTLNPYKPYKSLYGVFKGGAK